MLSERLLRKIDDHAFVGDFFNSIDPKRTFRLNASAAGTSGYGKVRCLLPKSEMAASSCEFAEKATNEQCKRTQVTGALFRTTLAPSRRCYYLGALRHNRMAM